MTSHTRSLDALREELAGRCPVLVGFPGVGGGYLPNVIPPPLLFYSPAVLLLNDAILIPDHVFDLDVEETQETVPYRVMKRLAEAGVVRFVSCSDEPAIRALRPDLLKEAADVAAVLLPDCGLGKLSAADVQRAVQTNEFPDGVPRDQQLTIRHVFRNVYDAVFLHGLAQALRFAYAVVNDDFSSHAAWHRSRGRDFESMVICVFQVPISRASILLDHAGQYADLVPEAILIPQRLMNGIIRLREPDGLERPYRPPDQRRSLDATEKIMSLRSQKEFVELRKILREWRVGLEVDGADAQRLQDLGQRCEVDLNRLLPSIQSALNQVGQPAPAMSLVVEDPEPCSWVRALGAADATHLPLLQIHDHGSTPIIAGARVLRQRDPGRA